MLGSRSKNSNSKQSRRLYLFVLLTPVFFIAALFAFPQPSSDSRLTTVTVELNRVDDPELVQDIVVASIKKQLGSEQLSQTLATISGKTTLASRILRGEGVDQVRNNLMGGALNLESIDLDTGSESSRNSFRRMGFSISLKGGGSADEVEFVKAMADEIRDALEPSTIRDKALAKLGEIQSSLREFGELNKESQKGVVASLDKYVSGQNRLFTSTNQSPNNSETSKNNWELKNLTEQRRLTFTEYQANQALEFSDKAAVQESLKRRIEYLDQEIDRLRKESSRGDRLAKGNRGVEKASFVESPENSESANGHLRTLQANMALAVNKMVLAQNSQKSTQQMAKQLSSLLQQNQIQVSISKPQLENVKSKTGSRVWLLLLASGALGSLIVLRIDSRAFATLLQDENAVESALNLPVVGRVKLPNAGNASQKKIQQLNRLVASSIKICELVLIVAFVLFAAVLWANSDVSLNWLNDPVGTLKSSFR